MNNIIKDTYTKNRNTYNQIWKKKKKINIILFFFFLIPGIIYYFAVYSTKEAIKKRSDLANEVLKLSLNSKIEEIESYNSKFDISFIKSIATIGVYRSGSDFSKDTNNICQQIYNQIEKNNLIDGFWSRKDTRLSSDTISSKVIIQANALIDITINSINFKGYSFSYYLKEVRREKTKDGYKDSTHTYNIFTGTYITSSDYEINYEGQIFIEDKDFKLRIHRKYNNIKKPKYDIVTKEFKDNFNIAVSNDDGVALNNLFQPRIVAKLIDYKNDYSPFAISNLSNDTTFLFRTKGAGNDYAFNIEKISKFFKDEDIAMKLIANEINYLESIYEIINYLQDNYFLKKIEPKL